MADYNGYFVDENHSAEVEKTLFLDGVLVANVTYTTRWQGDANSGAVKITKLAKGTVKTDGSGIYTRTTPTNPGNSILTLALDKPYFDSEDLPQVTINSVSYDMVGEWLENIAESVREKWTEDMLQDLADGGTPEVGLAPTSATIHADLVATRKSLVDNGAKPTTIMASSASYATMLKSPDFISASALGDRVKATAQVGEWLGLAVFEYAGFGVLTIDGNTIDYVMYDYKTFGIASNLNEARVVGLEAQTGFAGVTPQVGINSGNIVTDAERAITRNHA